jgi:hypothetical protein
MRPISLNTGVDEVMMARDQPQFKELPAAVYRDEVNGAPVYLMRYKLSLTEIDAIRHGEDIYLSMLGGVAPHTLCIGKPEWA